jgi:hypothetical protein
LELNEGDELQESGVGGRYWLSSGGLKSREWDGNAENVREDVLAVVWGKL